MTTKPQGSGGKNGKNEEGDSSKGGLPLDTRPKADNGKGGEESNALDKITKV